MEDGDEYLDDVEEVAARDPAAEGAGAADSDSDDGASLAAEEEAEVDADGSGADADGGGGGGDAGARPRIAHGPDASSCALAGHCAPVYCVALEGRARALAATGGGDDAVRLWAVAPAAAGAMAEPLHVLRGHGDSVCALAFSASGRLLASAACDGGVRVWRAAGAGAGACLAVLDGPGAEVGFLAWHPRGDVLAAGSTDATVWLWAVDAAAAADAGADADAAGAGAAASVSVMHVFAGHVGEVRAGAWASGGKGLLTGDSEGVARLWAPRTGSCLHIFSGRDYHGAAINALAPALSADRATFATAGEDGTVRLANAATGKYLLTLRHYWRKDRPAPGAAGAAAAAGAGAGVGAMAPADDAAAEHPSIECLAFSEDETFLATGSNDGSLTVWDVGTGSVRHILPHSDTVIRVAWLAPAVPDGHALKPAALGKLVAACADGNLYLWDGRDGRMLRCLTGHAGMILDLSVGVSPDTWPGGPTVLALTAGDDELARVFALL